MITSGYMERHRQWMVADDHLFLIPEPLHIYTSLPECEATVQYYQDCFPDVELTIDFDMGQEELKLYTEGELHGAE
jgi:hypothetical protein